MRARRLTAILLIQTVWLLLTCSKGPGVSGDKVREYANALYNRELYEQAVREYRNYLDLYPMDDQQRANINFIIGNIYFERLHQYEDAMAYYLKVKHVFPESNLMPQVDKQIVACLERLQRSADAKQALDEATSLEPEKLTPSIPGTVIAKIGDREITSGDLSHLTSQLPEALRSQLDNREAKLEFLRQYVATELFYDAAKRKGMDSDKGVIEGTFQAKKSLMVQKYLEDEISKQIQLTPEDVELYYKANRDRYAEKDDKGKVIRERSFQEAGKDAAEDLVRERQQKAYMELVQRMMNAEKVAIYDDLVR